MIIPINLEKNLPVFYEKIDRVENKIYNSRTGQITFYDGIYKPSSKIILEGNLVPHVRMGEPKSTKGKHKYIIYRSKYNKDHELILVDDVLMFLRVKKLDDVSNVVYSIQEPQLYIIKKIIRSNKPHKSYNRIKDERASNAPVALMSIKEIPEDLFVTVKIDGITAMIGYLLDYGVYAYDLKGKLLYHDSSVLKREENLFSRDIVFLGEYHNGCFYLFMEANDISRDFKVDYRNMKKFEEKYGDTNKIRTNYMVLSNKGDRYQDIFKKIIKKRDGMEKVNGKIPETDGFIIGSQKTKMQYKWKPIDLITVDFYILYNNGIAHLYVGQRKYAALKNKRAKKMKRSAPAVVKWSKDYYFVLFSTTPLTIAGKFHEKIVECKMVNNKWIPFRIRRDKEVPNNIRTAINNLRSLRNPINFSDLIT